MIRDEDSDQVSVSEFSQEEDTNSHGSSDIDPPAALSKKKKKKENEIGSKESKHVFRAKLMVYIVLIAACLSASILTYFFTSGENTKSFKRDFKSTATHLVRSAKRRLVAKFLAAETLVIALSSYGSDPSTAFPYITLPDFEERVDKIIEITAADIIVWAPLINKTESSKWINYSLANQGWIRDSMVFRGLDDVDPQPVPDNIHSLLRGDEGSVRYGPVMDLSGFIAPVWQSGRVPIDSAVINADFLMDETFNRMAGSAITHRAGVFSHLLRLGILKYFPHNRQVPHSMDEPHSFIVEPVFEKPGMQGDIVGFVYMALSWVVFLYDLLPEGTKSMLAVVRDDCGGKQTYRLDGSSVVYVGEGDMHEPKFDNLKIGDDLANELRTGGHFYCNYYLEIYPTSELESVYDNDDPMIYSVVVACIFVFTTMVFLVYDWAVQRRQWMIIRAARKTQAIVSSLFPKNVQDRIMKDVDDEVNRETNRPLVMRGNRTKDQLQNFLKGKEGQVGDAEEAGPGTSRSKPIADLFPEATIIFADIVGFTAWSSTREPSQVFQLLETIYHVFDDIANRRRVFKVETVGDCYVAVAGLPEPRKDHAIVMARFARDCLVQFNATVKAMVVELGPDTEELGVRIGLHSGPVTAGVLRGERARFQLFGDTVNTTARMESTGQPNRIHVSQETADLLTAAGKAQWLRVRREKVVAKGKGELQTYWLDASGEAGTSQHSGESEEDAAAQKGKANAEAAKPIVAPAAPAVPSADKYNRLVAWNCDILAKLLTQIVARRESRRTEPDPVSEIKKLEEQYGSNRYVLSEVQEIVRLPKYEADSQRVDPWSVKLSDEVLGQLKDYVQTLAAMYRDNPFHNFEHASHVTMSVMKLLSRIVAPDLTSTPTETEEALHDHTYGITSDPMTQFAVALSALIHDVDHPGVPNAQLIKEQTSLAAVYRNKSIAEQNSVDLAWDLLMDDAYADLRRAIYVTKTEFMRFRQLVVNIVLATDIMDKDLGALRKGRWNKAFGESSGCTEDDVNRKATIVMEHLIQASDVAHTMQHWHIYRKWNQRLFKEMYVAWINGRAEKDPSENWYNGEKGFFDFYIIPLAKKLKDCGVFGVSSDEYLQYAVQNRKEWEIKGEELVAEMLQGFRDQGLVPPVAPPQEEEKQAEAEQSATPTPQEQAPPKPSKPQPVLQPEQAPPKPGMANTKSEKLII